VIAADVRDTDLADYQRAVRILLVHPLVTETHPTPTALPLIRRFAQPLAADLETVAGYRLMLDATCARLVRRIDRLDPTQAVRRHDGKPFDRRRYAYLCLVLAALSRAGTQVALTELADALKRRAAEVDPHAFDPDQYRHRLAFVDVVRHLLDLGALAQVEASAVDWVRDPDAGEALYDVDRDVVHLLFVPPRVIQHVGSARALTASATPTGRDARRAATRQRLSRLLLEHPVVAVDDLPDDDRRYLTSQAASIAEDLHRLTGGQVERRAEGLALVDATGGFSDRRFPAGGTPAQAALLLADAMAQAVVAGDATTVTVPRADELDAALIDRLDAARPAPPAAGVDGDDDGARGDVRGGQPPATDDAAGLGPDLPAAQGPFFADAWLGARAQALIASYGRTFAADLRHDPAALLAAALEGLVAFDLVRPVAGGVVARPALARFRDVVVALPEPPQLSLLDPSES
jgi:uncharacterized protein (TIGR02678 family)